jgi:hypothetical protein
MHIKRLEVAANRSLENRQAAYVRSRLAPPSAQAKGPLQSSKYNRDDFLTEDWAGESEPKIRATRAPIECLRLSCVRIERVGISWRALRLGHTAEQFGTGAAGSCCTAPRPLPQTRIHAPSLDLSLIRARELALGFPDTATPDVLAIQPRRSHWPAVLPITFRPSSTTSARPLQTESHRQTRIVSIGQPFPSFRVMATHHFNRKRELHAASTWAIPP